MGIPPERSFLLENGDILELDSKGGEVVGRVPSGYVYVDGLGVGDISKVVLRDRSVLSKDGVVVVILAVDKATGRIVASPDVVSRGFVDLTESEALMEKSRRVVIRAIDRGEDHLAEHGFITTKVKDALGKFLYSETKRRPMILPIAVEV
jgi:ribonuclease J